MTPREYMAAKRAADPEFRARQVAKSREIRHRHMQDPKKFAAELARGRSRYARLTPEQKRDRLLRKYGLTAAQYDAMVEARGGLCDICGRPTKDKIGKLVVDHDHATGKVRGLLCIPCNVRVGVVEHELFNRTVDYVQKGGGA